MGAAARVERRRHLTMQRWPRLRRPSGSAAAVVVDAAVAAGKERRTGQDEAAAVAVATAAGAAAVGAVPGETRGAAGNMGRRRPAKGEAGTCKSQETCNQAKYARARCNAQPHLLLLLLLRLQGLSLEAPCSRRSRSSRRCCFRPVPSRSVVRKARHRDCCGHPAPCRSQKAIPRVARCRRIPCSISTQAPGHVAHVQ